MDDERSPDVIGHALAELCQAAGLEGAAALDRSDMQRGEVFLYQYGGGGQDVLILAGALLAGANGRYAQGIGSDRRPVVVFPWVLPPRRPGGLVLWRSPGSRPWDAGDHVLVETVAGLIRIILEHSPDESGLDRLTGLPTGESHFGFA